MPIYFLFLSKSYFNPRSSCEERLLKSLRMDSRHHFNPRSSCEERLMHVSAARGRRRFQSTLLMRGATSIVRPPMVFILFQSTLLMRGATVGSPSLKSGTDFNPRSSCEERPPFGSSCCSTDDFNPRSSCEERLHQTLSVRSPIQFQSTLLMRGATL